MIAKCYDDPSKEQPESKGDSLRTQGKKNHRSKIKTTECSQGKISRGPDAPSQKMQLYCDENRIQLLEVDDTSLDGSVLNGTIEYNQSYRLAETGSGSASVSSESSAVVNNGDASCSGMEKKVNFECDLSGSDLSCSQNQNVLNLSASQHDPQPSSSQQPTSDHEADLKQSSFKPPMRPRGSFTLDLNKPISMECDNETDSLNSITDDSEDGMLSSTASYEDFLEKANDPIVRTARDLSLQLASSQAVSMQEPKREEDKYLIFTTGRKTYTPHQIGIKRIKHDDTSVLTSHQPQPVSGRAEESQKNSLVEAAGGGAPLVVNAPVEPEGEGGNDIEFDSVDHLIELHGHIIGMCLSPDER